MAIFRPPFIPLLAGLLLCLELGCATLPNVSEIVAEAPTPTPKILSAKGLLSREQSRAILQRLQGASQTTELVERYNALLELVSGLPLTKGNKVTLLTDGRSAYAAMLKAIGNAANSINMETYKIDDDEIGRRFIELLLKKQSQGVQVNFMYDSIGSLSTPPSFFERLRHAGVKVVKVSSLLPFSAPEKRLSIHADHRKLLIVDGKLVIVGGINISRVYASVPFHRGKKAKPSVPWRDTDILIEGPAVGEFQKLFVEMWSKQQGPQLLAEEYFPKLQEQGNALVRAIGSTPGESNRITYISYLSALNFAERTVYLTCAYFIPDRQILNALTEAAKRGVDVTIILPSISDSPLVLYAMRYNYSGLLESKVKLYERRKALLHAKTAVIDHVWSTVGSTNMDFLSLSDNYEIDAVVLSGEFAAEMEKLFTTDLEQSEQIHLEQWEKRSVLERMRELFAHLLSHIM